MTVPIAFCSSEQYLDLVLTAVWSALLHRSYDDEYKIYILHIDISQEQQNRFNEALKSWGKCEVRFVDVSDSAAQYTAEEQIKETWFSLLLPELFPEYRKILALDADLIVQRDLAELFSTNVDGVFLAAALDPDFIGQYHGGNPRYRKYYGTVVPLKNPYNYVQGGVYVMNLEQIREAFPHGVLFREAAEQRFLYDDQDEINLRCACAIRKLDMRWNVLYDSLGYRRRLVIGLAPKEVRDDYEAARSDPWIIHYAGGRRPWQDMDVDFAREFWMVADRTPAAERFHRRIEEEPKRHRRTLLPRRVFREARFWLRKITITLTRKI